MPTGIFVFLFQLRLILYLVTKVSCQSHKDGIWDWLNHIFNLECNAKFKENTGNLWHVMPITITINVSPAVDKVPTQGNILHFLTWWSLTWMAQDFFNQSLTYRVFFKFLLWWYHNRYLYIISIYVLYLSALVVDAILGDYFWQWIMVNFYFLLYNSLHFWFIFQ